MFSSLDPWGTLPLFNLRHESASYRLPVNLCLTSDANSSIEFHFYNLIVYSTTTISRTVYLLA